MGRSAPPIGTPRCWPKYQIAGIRTSHETKLPAQMIAADYGRLEQHLRLLAAPLAGDENLRDRRPLGERQKTVLIPHEVSPQRDYEEYPEKSAEK